MDDEERKRKIEYQIENFNAELIPFGSRDVAVAVETAIDVG